jgi:multiple sugar transport system permease protein
MMKKKSGFKHLLKEITLHKTCYLFLAPYAIIFGLFVVAPVVVSIFYSFTYYNILETPKFIGLRN